ncbi:MAG TPA: beta-L-arabinofuranosidase domain-containing protein, partial [Chitinophagaceae bacterium]|nr:beta-L-arabinofuranosidase domain-containing protein [Chitinophagaceae bacterium]
QDEAEGHAVRAGYLYSAVADVAALTGDDSLLSAIDKIWENVVEKKTYVQGGVGALGDGERYGKNYELPNATAYNETCAAISNIYWNHRMFLLHGDSKYIDVLEKTLYNGMLSGIGLDGKSFFYTNAMQVREGFGAGRVESTRSGWFECSCCPTNLARIIPSIPGYVYGQKNDDIYINLFINSTTNLLIRNKPVEIIQQNNYPWEGNLVFLVSPSASTNFSLFVRIPGWAREEAMPSGLYKFESAANSPISIQVNGQPIEYKMQNGYAIITRTWKRNDKLEVTLPMEVRRVVANDLIKENIGKISLQRGPLTYCAEWPDNHGKTSNIILPEGTRFTTEFKPDLLAGLTIIKGEAPAIVIRDAFNISTVTQAFTAIPYYSWANRGKGEMMVWFPTRVKYLDLLPN